MPAELSEGGFHTNPTQNLRNMNEEYKRLEARSLWISILDYYSVPRPPIRTVVGFVTDKNTGRPLNEVFVETDGRTYKTDSYYDKFSQWEVTDTTLGNGIYYFENLPAGTNNFTFRKEGYAELSVATDVSENFFTFLDVALESSVTSVDRGDGDQPYTFSLQQNFPNPFNPSTVISFRLPASGRVKVQVLDVLGRAISTLVDKDLSAGPHQVLWHGVRDDGSAVSSGVYFYRLQQGPSIAIRKMIFLR